jgi:hypothetical protein
MQIEVRAALIELAARFDALADQREQAETRRRSADQAAFR